MSGVNYQKREREWTVERNRSRDFKFFAVGRRTLALQLLDAYPASEADLIPNFKAREVEWDITGAMLLGSLGRIITTRQQTKRFQWSPIQRPTVQTSVLEREVTIHRSGPLNFGPFSRPVHWDREAFFVHGIEEDGTVIHRLEEYHTVGIGLSHGHLLGRSPGFRETLVDMFVQANLEAIAASMPSN